MSGFAECVKPRGAPVAPPPKRPDAAPTPASPFADLVDGRIEAALTTLIDSQAEDGGWTWNPEWAWGFVDKRAWADAHRDWRGQMTRETLETLLAYGRVET